jgi:hypothetical protein
MLKKKGAPYRALRAQACARLQSVFRQARKGLQYRQEVKVNILQTSISFTRTRVNMKLLMSRSMNSDRGAKQCCEN